MSKNSGITLIALVVTIIVLLILTGISISMLTGQNGILNRTSEAKENTKENNIKENIELAINTLQISHLGNFQEVTQSELQEELGNDYIVSSSNTFDIYYKKSNLLFRVQDDKTVKFVGKATLNSTTKNGDKEHPIILEEKGISNIILNYADNQNISIWGTNRFNIEKSDFYMNGYNSKHEIVKDNNGITIKSEEFDENISSAFAYTDMIAEFSGKIWVSCDASSNGDVRDLGMRISINGISQELCRGEGKLAESINVQCGDTIRLIFYSHIGTSKNNILNYKNIMVQYGTLTGYSAYSEKESTFVNKYNEIILNGSEGIDAYTTNTTANGGTDYSFYFNSNITDSADDVLSKDNNKIANVIVDGLDLIDYNSVYKNKIGLGISSSGKICIYVGKGYNRETFVEYLKEHPITIKYKTNNIEFIKVKTDNISTGNIITSDSEFSITYSYIDNEKTKKMVCFGDSITGMFNNETDYPSIIERETNLETYNVGFSGCQWTDHKSEKYLPFSMNRLVDAICDNDFSLQNASVDSCGQTYINRLNTLKSIDFSIVDYITIFYGTNDWANDAILKSSSDNEDLQKQRTNVEDSMKYCISRLQTKYPNIKIIVITPYWRYFNNADSSIVTNNNGNNLREFSNYMENVARNELKIETINMYNQLNINITNYNNYLSDGTHPNEKLKYIIAQIIENKIMMQ